MKIDIPQETLATELSAVAGIIQKDKGVAAHECVLIEPVVKGEKSFLRMTTANGVAQCETYVSDTAIKISKDGDEAVCVPAKKLLEWVKLLNGGMVTIAVDQKGNALVSCGTANTRLKALAPSHFHRIVDKFEAPIEIKADVLGSMIRMTKGFIGEDDSNFAFDGGLLSIKGSTLAMMATDNRRTAYASAEATSEADLRVLVPTKSLVQLRDMLSISDTVLLAVSRDARGGVNRLKFRCGHRFLTTILRSGKFPDVEMAIERNATSINSRLILDRDEFRSAIKRTLVVSDDHNRSVSFHLGGDGEELALATDGQDIGADTIRINRSSGSADLSFVLNGDLLTQFLTVVPDDEVEISVGGPLNFVELKGVDETCNFKYLMAPLRSLS